MLTLPCDMTACPPKTDDMSTTVTFAPPRPSSSAADNPEIPAPTTITSAVLRSGPAGAVSFGGGASDTLTAPVLGVAGGSSRGEHPASGAHANNDPIASRALSQR